MKTEFKGTQGEWNVELKKEMISIHTGESSAEVEHGKGNWVDPNICGIWAHIDYIERGTCVANAYLISAAPNLLEALQLLIDNGYAPKANKDLARNAIKKALNLA